MRPYLAALALAAALTLPSPADANMARAVDDGDRTGALIPESAPGIRIDAETLSFDLAPDLASARVVASYLMTNTGAAQGADIAFAFVRGDHRGDRDAGPHALIQVDRVTVPYRTRTDADVLAPRLQAWLAAHPDLATQLAAVAARADGDHALAAPVAAAGGGCGYDCDALVRWYKQTKGGIDPLLGQETADRNVVYAAREAIPGAVDEITRGWTTRSDRPAMSWLLFHVDFAPGQERTVAVVYDQQATEDRAAHVNTTFSFDYLLSPAKRWASFGPLDVEVKVPAGVRLTSPAPFHDNGGVYDAMFPTLPEGELRFEIMSRRGLWFGMTEPGGYWAILIVAMTLAALGVGSATSGFWTARPRWQRTALRLFVAGPIAAAGSGAALAVLGSAFPSRALGFGYGGALGSILLLFLAIPAGALASAFRGNWANRRREDLP